MIWLHDFEAVLTNDSEADNIDTFSIFTFTCCYVSLYSLKYSKSRLIVNKEAYKRDKEMTIVLQ